MIRSPSFMFCSWGLLLLLALGETLGKSQNRKTVLQSDHFVGMESRTVSYVLDNVLEDRPLVLVLKE
jgi:hypothetical protein